MQRILQPFQSFFHNIPKACKNYLRTADILLLLLAAAASCCGLVLIYSATRSFGTNRYVLIQAASVALGVLGFIIASHIDLDRIGPWWRVVFVLNIGLQCLLFKFGVEGNTGNRSWIRFDDWGLPIGIQPAELGKILFILTFSRHIYELRDRLNAPLSVLQLLVHAGLTAGVVYVTSKDFGMAIVYLLIFYVLFFASGVSLAWVGALTVTGGAGLAVLWPYLPDYQRLRILVVFEPELSERYAYQGKQGMMAIGSGQLTGEGFLSGRMTQAGSGLPAKHTDFIFATAGEEWGFIGCVLIIVLLSAIVFRIFYDSTQTNDLFSRLMCIGIGGMLMVQILINIGMCAGVMPVIGLTLPFFSYGGTSSAVTLTCLGLVSGFIMRQKPRWLRDRL